MGKTIKAKGKHTILVVRLEECGLISSWVTIGNMNLNVKQMTQYSLLGSYQRWDSYGTSTNIMPPTTKKGN